VGGELGRGAKQGRRGGRRGKLIEALIWQHRWGSKVEGELDKVERGIEPAAWLFTQPEIWTQNRFYWEAFNELSSERQIGMGMGPIPRSAIKRYAAEFAIEGEDYDVFHSIIRQMDNKYISLANSPSKNTNDKGMVAEASDPDRTRAVMEVIKARAAAANKRQTKQKKMH
jgi:hypothetical protein